MTIDNILSRTRNSPAKMPILLLALLPVPPKFTGKSARSNEAEPQTNADTLRAFFDLVMEPLQPVVQEGTVMDCADRKTRLCFPILSAWIADHAEHAALQGIGSKSCPKCEVPCKELSGNPRWIYETCDYMLYREKALRHEPAEVAGIAEYFQRLGVKIENNVFTGLNQVSPADLHKPALLHNTYFGLFKHMMEWVEGFLKKHKRQQAFDDSGKDFLLTPDSAYRKRPIAKSHNSKERQCTILAVVFQPYWHQHCEIRTLLNIRISRAL